MYATACLGSFGFRLPTLPADRPGIVKGSRVHCMLVTRGKTQNPRVIGRHRSRPLLGSRRHLERWTERFPPRKAPRKDSFRLQLMPEKLHPRKVDCPALELGNDLFSWVFLSALFGAGICLALSLRYPLRRRRNTRRTVTVTAPAAASAPTTRGDSRMSAGEAGRTTVTKTLVEPTLPDMSMARA